MDRRKKVSFVSIIIIIWILILALVFANKPRWVSIYDTNYCENLKHETITKITMRKTTDSVVEVIFSDEDLIDEWTAIFNSMEVKYNWKNTHFMEKRMGGQPLLTVETDQGSYTFAFNERKDGYLITINRKRYLIKDPNAVRFHEIYVTALERHGTTPIF